MKRIPIYRGDEVVTEALVDDDDFEVLASSRWRLGRFGHAERSLNGKTQAMHREIVGLRSGEGKVVHHINEDRLDNRRSNLKVCEDHSEHGIQPHPKKEAKAQATLRARILASPGGEHA